MSYTTKQSAIAPFILRIIYHLLLVLQNLKGLWFETRGDDSVTDLSLKNLFEKVIWFPKNDLPSIKMNRYAKWILLRKGWPESVMIDDKCFLHSQENECKSRSGHIIPWLWRHLRYDLWLRSLRKSTWGPHCALSHKPGQLGSIQRDQLSHMQQPVFNGVSDMTY